MPQSPMFLAPMDDDDTAVVGPPDQDEILTWLYAGSLVYQDEGGTTPVLSTNDRVGRWSDISGHNNHFQLSGNQRPVWNSSYIPLNNRPTVAFPVEPSVGIDSTYLLNSTIDYSGEWSWFMAYAHVDRAWHRNVFRDANGKGFYLQAATSLPVLTDGTPATIILSTHSPINGLRTIIAGRSGVIADLMVDIPAGVGSHANAAPWTTPIMLGQDVAAEPIDIHISEIILWGKRLDDAGRDQLFAYLKSRYDL